jgi:hypothetical protein
MSRVKDYAQFAAWFAGLGYVVLWPLITLDHDGVPFGSPLLCRPVATLFALACDPAHAPVLPGSLHALGLVCAIFLTLHLVVMARQRSVRRRIASGDLPKPLVLMMPRLRRRKPPLARVKPRKQFGLRGMPPR